MARKTGKKAKRESRRKFFPTIALTRKTIVILMRDGAAEYEPMPDNMKWLRRQVLDFARDARRIDRL